LSRVPGGQRGGAKQPMALLLDVTILNSAVCTELEIDTILNSAVCAELEIDEST
jgi:hypothetical protein